MPSPLSVIVILALVSRQMSTSSLDNVNKEELNNIVKALREKQDTLQREYDEMRALWQTLLDKSGDHKRLLAEQDPQEALLNRVNELQQIVNRLDADAKDNPCCSKQGAVYTRWGHKSCPNDTYTELVYSGQAGGSYYTQYGGAANYVCLPPNPDTGAPTNPAHTAYMYGAEYEFPPKSENDVPCAVCRTTLGTAVYMVPGRMTCDPGWAMAYKGILTSGFPLHHAPSEFVCLDSQMEILNGGAQNEDGKLFYPVAVHCGSLKCPPYTGGRELLCAVCVK